MNTLLHEGLMRTKNLSHAAIIKRKGHAIKAKSHAFQLTLEEIKQLDACFASFQEIRTTSEPAVTVMHIPYKAIRCDEYSFYGKNVSAQAIEACMLRTPNSLSAKILTNTVFEIPSLCRTPTTWVS